MTLVQAVLRRGRAVVWRFVECAHAFDFQVLLPTIARLPVKWGFAAAALRGRVNAMTGRDWRSVAIGYRHIRRQSLEGYKRLPLHVAPQQQLQWSRQRFAVEAREEFEAKLVAAKRVSELTCSFKPVAASTTCSDNKRGLLLLTLHFDSFFLGAAFLAKSGGTINFMSSSITHDPRVNKAVQAHFESKYRGMEHYLNGGAIVNMEEGMRPFYRMLERNETLIVLGDSPALPNGATMKVDFLGGSRVLAGGALRLAQRSGCDLGGYICHHRGGGHYELEVCRIGPAEDPKTIQAVYDFFSQSILQNPGKWWASDLLPHMPRTPD